MTSISSLNSFSLEAGIARLALHDPFVTKADGVLFQTELSTLEQNLKSPDILEKIVALRERCLFRPRATENESEHALQSEIDEYHTQWSELFEKVVHTPDMHQKQNSVFIQRLLHLGLIDQVTLLRQVTDCPEKAGDCTDRVIAAAFRALHISLQNSEALEVPKDACPQVVAYVTGRQKLQRFASLERDQLLQELEISPAQIRDCFRAYEEATKSTPPFSGEAFENLKIKLEMLSNQVDKSVDPTVLYYPKWRQKTIPPFDCLLNFLSYLFTEVRRKGSPQYVENKWAFSSAMDKLIPENEVEKKGGVLAGSLNNLSPYLLFPLVEEAPDRILEMLPTSTAFIQFARNCPGAATLLAELRAHDVVRLFSSKNELQKLAEVHVGIVYMLASKEPRLISKLFSTVVEVARFALHFRRKMDDSDYSYFNDQLNIINGLKICTHSDKPEIVSQAQGMKEGTSRFMQLKSGTCLWRAAANESDNSLGRYFAYRAEDITSCGLSLLCTDKFGRPSIKSLKQFTLQQDAWFLQTVANPIKDSWTIPAASFESRGEATQLLFIEESNELENYFALTNQRHWSDLIQKQSHDPDNIIDFLQEKKALTKTLITLLDINHEFNKFLNTLKTTTPEGQLSRLYIELDDVVSEAGRRDDNRAIQSVYTHFPELPNSELAFEIAISKNSLDLMNFFIHRGGTPIWLQDIMLHDAVRFGCIEALQLLLSVRGDLGARCTMKRNLGAGTLLQTAIRTRTYFQTLLKMKTDSERKNHEEKFFKIIQILLDAGADTDLALYTTLEICDIDVMKLLLDKGVTPKDAKENSDVQFMLDIDKKSSNALSSMPL